MIRRATLEDVGQMSAVHALTWKVTYKGVFSQRFLDKLPLNNWTEGFKRGIAANKNTFLVYEKDNQIVGVVVLGNSRWREDVGEIYSLYVLPAYQTQGIGRALMEEILQIAQQQYQLVHLVVVCQNKQAQQFYEKMGFVNTQQMIDSEVAGGKFQGYLYEQLVG